MRISKIRKNYFTKSDNFYLNLLKKREQTLLKNSLISFKNNILVFFHY